MDPCRRCYWRRPPARCHCQSLQRWRCEPGMAWKTSGTLCPEKKANTWNISHTHPQLYAWGIFFPCGVKCLFSSKSYKRKKKKKKKSSSNHRTQNFKHRQTWPVLLMYWYTKYIFAMLVFYSYTLHFNLLVVFHTLHISLFSYIFFFVWVPFYFNLSKNWLWNSLS